MNQKELLEKCGSLTCNITIFKESPELYGFIIPLCELLSSQPEILKEMHEFVKEMERNDRKELFDFQGQLLAGIVTLAIKDYKSSVKYLFNAYCIRKEPCVLLLLQKITSSEENDKYFRKIDPKIKKKLRVLPNQNIATILRNDELQVLSKYKRKSASIQQHFEFMIINGIYTNTFVLLLQFSIHPLWYTLECLDFGLTTLLYNITHHIVPQIIPYKLVIQLTAIATIPLGLMLAKKSYTRNLDYNRENLDLSHEIVSIDMSERIIALRKHMHNRHTNFSYINFLTGLITISTMFYFRDLFFSYENDLNYVHKSGFAWGGVWLIILIFEYANARKDRKCRDINLGILKNFFMKLQMTNIVKLLTKNVNFDHVAEQMNFAERITSYNIADRFLIFCLQPASEKISKDQFLEFLLMLIKALRTYSNINVLAFDGQYMLVNNPTVPVVIDNTLHNYLQRLTARLNSMSEQKQKIEAILRKLFSINSGSVFSAIFIPDRFDLPCYDYVFDVNFLNDNVCQRIEDNISIIEKHFSGFSVCVINNTIYFESIDVDNIGNDKDSTFHYLKNVLFPRAIATDNNSFFSAYANVQKYTKPPKSVVRINPTQHKEYLPIKEISQKLFDSTIACNWHNKSRSINLGESPYLALYHACNSKSAIAYAYVTINSETLMPTDQLYLNKCVAILKSSPEIRNQRDHSKLGSNTIVSVTKEEAKSIDKTLIPKRFQGQFPSYKVKSRMQECQLRLFLFKVGRATVIDSRGKERQVEVFDGASLDCGAHSSSNHHIVSDADPWSMGQI